MSNKQETHADVLKKHFIQRQVNDIGDIIDAKMADMGNWIPHAIMQEILESVEMVISEAPEIVDIKVNDPEEPVEPVKIEPVSGDPGAFIVIGHDSGAYTSSSRPMEIEFGVNKFDKFIIRRVDAGYVVDSMELGFADERRLDAILLAIGSMRPHTRRY